MVTTLNNMISRKILGAYVPGPTDEGWTVGKHNCKSIQLYNEDDGTSYLQIILDDGREIRANTKHYDVLFAPEK